MEILLAKVTQQAMSYAIRSGIAITSTYALKQCGRLMKTVDGQEKEELTSLQLRLASKIKIISPAIDMIELISARGNTSLESAVTLTKSLRWDIQSLGSRVEMAVVEEQLSQRGSSKATSRAQNEAKIKTIILEIKRLLNRIEDAVPLINLAITTSGVSLHTTLPATVSPSRLLQASTFLTAGDMQYCTSKPRAQQIGPVFTLSMYMLFSGHTNRSHVESFRETTWKEVMHKARVTLLRVPLDCVCEYPQPFGQTVLRSDKVDRRQIPSENILQEFAYQLLIVEDLDDGRVHSFDDDEPHPEPYDGVEQAGIREIIPIHELSKIFYADTGKILNIGTDGESNNPVLLLKRDVHAAPPRRMMDREAVETEYESDDTCSIGKTSADSEQIELEAQFQRESTPFSQDQGVCTEPELPDFPWRLPPTLDLEWVALEVYAEDSSADSDMEETEESEVDNSSSSPTESASADDSASPALHSRLADLNLDPLTLSTTSPSPEELSQLTSSPKRTSVPVPEYTQQVSTSLPPIKTSLSLLEMLVRLTALQQFQQSSHLAIPDEFLNFFLSDSSTVGAGGDAELRRQVRREARMRVGFDPYDESPIKRRGEEYLEHELHDAEDNNDALTPGNGTPYDYEGRPWKAVSTVYSRSRSGTPDRSFSQMNFTPPISSLSKSSTGILGSGKMPKRNVVSPTPLLRRATTKSSQRRDMRRSLFESSPAAPPTISSAKQRQDGSIETQSFGGSVVRDTPPKSAKKLT